MKATTRKPATTKSDCLRFNTINILFEFDGMEVFQSPTCAYEKVSQIGQGTYGRVYLCRKQGTEEQYAVKMLKMTKEEM